MESTDQSTPRAKLINILQLAYSGELAAAYAYRGHWHSLTDPDERAQVKTIEDEEWHHRKLVGEMLKVLALVQTNDASCERLIVGRTLGLSVSRQRLVCADVRRGPA